jgi:hypothetical protein
MFLFQFSRPRQIHCQAIRSIRPGKFRLPETVFCARLISRAFPTWQLAQFRAVIGTPQFAFDLQECEGLFRTDGVPSDFPHQIGPFVSSACFLALAAYFYRNHDDEVCDYVVTTLTSSP